MDFSKPYEPSASAANPPADQAGAEPPRRRPSQPIPALFRKKAA
jgi:hypothetical protein